MSGRALRAACVRTFGLLGGFRLTRAALRRSPRIFMYHRFTHTGEERKLPAAVFEQHLRELARSFRVVTMGALIEEFQTHGAIAAHTAVITVDDGHRDFLECAVPLLRRYGLPATLFATTRFIEGDFWLWPDRLEHALMQSREPMLDLGSEGVWPLADRADRRRAWNELVARCVRLPERDKQRLIDDAVAAAGVTLPVCPPPAYRSLSIDELRELAASGIEIGAHTETHPILTRIPAEDLDAEIAGSKLRLEEWLQRDVVSFCYPNGSPADYDQTVKNRVRAAGFRSAVAAHFRYDILDDLFEIKRYAGSADPSQFRRNACGVEYVSSWTRCRLGI